MFQFSKTVNVTTTRNVLCQIPRAVVADWGLKKGDTLELTYEDGTVTIKPNKNMQKLWQRATSK